MSERTPLATGGPREELPEALAEGRLLLGLAGGGALRWAVADITQPVETARARLDLSPVAAAAMGRAMAASALLLRLAVKTPSRLTLEIRGDGPLGRVLAEADAAGNLRAMVGDRRVDVPHTAAGKLAVGRAVGRGMLRVTRELAGGSYHSQVALVSGEIGEDLAHYLEQSEQTRSAVLVGVLGRPQGVTAAGGLIVEALPEAGGEVLARLEANIAAAGGVSRLVESGGDRGVLEVVLAGLEPKLVEETTLSYRCRCSRERLMRHLAPLPGADLEELADDAGVIEAECLFCANVYQFTPDELRSSG